MFTTEAQRKLTEQEKNPHPQLALARKAIETALQCQRRVAANVANHATHKQIKTVLDADGDAEKIRNVVQGIKAPELPPLTY